MSDYQYRAYSPNPNGSPTRRAYAGTPGRAGYPAGGREPGPPGAGSLGDGFEGWYDGTQPLSQSHSSPPYPPSGPNAYSSIPPPLPVHNSNVPPSLQPGSRSSFTPSTHSSRYDYDKDADLAFGAEPTPRRSRRSPSPPDIIPRRRSPSPSPVRSIHRDDRNYGAPARGAGGDANMMSNIFNAQNAAAVQGALGSAAKFLADKSGLQSNIQDSDDEVDRAPGGFDRAHPRPANNNAGGFNFSDAAGFLGNLTGANQPSNTNRQNQGAAAGGPNLLSSALGYLQNTSPQTVGHPRPGVYTLAGIDIDTNWIMQKAGQQNPLVLLGGGVVAFWVISSIIATVMWYLIIAGVLYVVYLVMMKNNTGAIGGNGDRRRVTGSSGVGRGTGVGSGGTAGARRRY